jgi:hypothetical protein
MLICIFASAVRVELVMVEKKRRMDKKSQSYLVVHCHRTRVVKEGVGRLKDGTSREFAESNKPCQGVELA